MGYSKKQLDRMVRTRVKLYYKELDDGPDTILSEEDAMGAALHVASVYDILFPGWPGVERALDIAFEEKTKYMHNITTRSL